LAGPTQTGWDANGPYAASQTASNKKGPYFEFPTNRLLLPPGGVIPRFVDPWGVPYAYFTASAGDTYDPRVSLPWPANPNQAYTPAATPYPDGFAQEQPSNGSYVVHPYRNKANGRWMNPGKFQIISAGPDQAFGAGSYMASTSPQVVVRDWTPGDPTSEYVSSGTTNFGYDDIANFNGGASLGETGNQ
jgi:hypothetical protein